MLGTSVPFNHFYSLFADLGLVLLFSSAAVADGALTELPSSLIVFYFVPLKNDQTFMKTLYKQEERCEGHSRPTWARGFALC
jgi:hypothetical protein